MVNEIDMTVESQEHEEGIEILIDSERVSIFTPSQTITLELPDFDTVVAEINRARKFASNARLIAAAPDLLEACEVALSEINLEVEQRKNSGNDEYWQGLQQISDQVYAAIRKATGQ